MSSIFISHSSANNDIAKEVAARLAQKNHSSIFLDLDPEAGIVAGQSWEQTLYRKIRACRAVIALCTDEYLASKWCFAEIALARMEGKLIFALKVDPLSPESRMPSILSERQYIDLRRNAEEGYERLWHGLEEEDILGVSGDWDSKQSPYLGLGAFQEEHAPVFFGREDETRLGLEMLGRGAPGLVMVLGASGTGKSSLVRAGLLPRLRRDTKNWIVVEPFRPGYDPFPELALSLESTYRKLGRDDAGSSWEQIRSDLAGAAGITDEPPSRPSPAKDEDVPDEQKELEDKRLHRLIVQLEELQDRPPPLAGDRLRDFLDLSLEEVREIYRGRKSAEAEPPVSEGVPMSLVERANELRRLDPERRDARVLLIVDQFEELLDRVDTDHRFDRFLGLLRASIEAEDSPIVVLGTMRSDFLGSFQRNPALRGIDFESLSLGSMRMEGMRRVIEEPARLGEVELESGLSDRLLKDTETPDALPLLSFTLLKLWEKYAGDKLIEISEYEHLGGLEGAVAVEAKAVLKLARRKNLEDELRRALLQMARLTEDGQYVRRPVDWDHRALQPVHAILEQFEERRLLVVRGQGDARIVEVAHETLFRSWRPLKKWLDDHREEMLLRAGIARDTATWVEASTKQDGAADDALWRGGRLERARELMGRMSLPQPEQDFIKAGVRHQNFKRNVGRGIAAAVFVTVSVLGIAAWVQKGRADSQRAAALDLARVAVATERGAEDPNVAALVLLEVQDPQATPFSGQRMRETLDAGLAIVLAGQESPIKAAAFSPDGSRVATGNSRGRARVLNSDGTGAPVVFEEHVGDEITSLDFSPDGQRVVTGGEDRAAFIWSANDGSLLATLGAGGGEVQDVEFDPDGTHVVTAARDARVMSASGTAESVTFTDHGDVYVWTAVFSSDGRSVVTAAEDWTARVWSADGSGEAVTLSGHTERLTMASFSPDGRRVVTASYDGTARIWPADGEGEAVVLEGHADTVWVASFSPDGSRVVTAGSDGTARLWDADGDSLAVLEGHGSAVKTAAFDAAAERVVTGSFDGTARVWDASTGQSIATLRGHQGPVTVALFDSSGQRVLTASDDGTARVWPANGRTAEPVVVQQLDDIEATTLSADGTRLAAVLPGSPRRLATWTLGSTDDPTVEALVGQSASVANLRFGREGRQIVTESSGMGAEARIWSVGQGARAVDTPWDRVSLVVVGPDGRILTSSTSAGLQLWPSTDGLVEGDPTSLGDHPNVSGAAFAHDGALVVTTSRDGDTRVWDVATATLQRTLGDSTGRRVSAPSFSPDGGLLLTVSADTTAQLWNVATGDSVATLRGHRGPIAGGVFDALGQRVMTFSADGTARIWNADGSGDPVVLSDYGVALLAGAFSPDGGSVFTVSTDGAVREWRTITHEGLREALRSSVNQCLEPDFRVQLLGQSQALAEAAYRACESENGRDPPIEAPGPPVA